MLTDEQRAEGWIEHDGGPCPVPLDSRVRVMFRDGVTPLNIARLWTVGFDWWRHEETVLRPHTDIIAYKPEHPHD